MARYALNLPVELKQEAELMAKQQGVSLNQFIQWAVAEKVGGLRQTLDDPRFPLITYRRGGSGAMQPMIRGTNLRVKTLVVAYKYWEMSAEQIADEWPVSESAVQEALAFYDAHRNEIDAHLTEEANIAQEYARKTPYVEAEATH
ncbi:MAG: DUF433 domain-containing protein [Chloroflexi bacterium]|nr:DUF433 domain-containing protein [Chloroflexota bacterium]